MKRIDIDNNGSIDIREFIAATINLKDVSEGGKLK
jgi:hypothetical protein